MKSKVLVIAVALMAVVMLTLPLSAVLAAKPEKFVNVTFYGYPVPVGFGLETYYAGESDNCFMIWTDLTWVFCWDMAGIETMAEGEYNGRWILHGYDPGPPPTSTGSNIHGIFNMEVTDWEGETGNLVIQGVDGKVNIISGTIGGKKVHGGGTSEAVIIMAFYKYELTIHFTP